MFTKILIANRGEIARRINRTAQAMGIQTVAVYSTADAQALHVQECNEAVCLGEPEAAQSYLNIDKVIAAARQTGAQAIHPGYGFCPRTPLLRRLVPMRTLPSSAPVWKPSGSWAARARPRPVCSQRVYRSFLVTLAQINRSLPCRLKLSESVFR